MPIQLLPDQLASQIAAGEVVERPFSVVKELVENAIDAGATAISIEVRGGGRQLIQIADNGSGIPAAEIETAFLRHATSKISSVEQLSAIQTLGFRGEALAAISAVSQLFVVSRTANEPAGTRLTLEGSHKTGRESVGAPQGTIIAVENLFYNTPARLKFLKGESTERRLIDEFVTRYALAYPGIRFRLTHDGRITFQTSGNGRLVDVLVTVYGPETARQLLEIEERGVKSEEDEFASRSSPIAVSGFVAPPSLHWANRNHITLFLNGRFIRDNSLTYAIIQAYHTLLPVGRYPLALVFITMPPEEVDVNVHPTKVEVRFRHSDAVFGAVQKAVRQILLTDTPIRHMGVWSTPRPSSPGWGGSLDDHAFVPGSESLQTPLELEWAGPAAPPANDEPTTQPTLPTMPPANSGDRLPIMRVVGQVGAAYIITEGPDGLFLIDQHAAHERILYEQFMAQWDKHAVSSQGLVAGTAVYLPPSQATLLETQLELMGKLGFQIESFGPNAFMVRAIPALLAKLDPAQAVVAVVEDVERGDAPLQDKIEAKIIRRVCKTAAIKAGQTLSQVEMETLIRQLETCYNPFTCPHGRPTFIHLSAAQLARQFGRT